MAKTIFFMNTHKILQKFELDEIVFQVIGYHYIFYLHTVYEKTVKEFFFYELAYLKC